jgi:hypothetical protein
MDWSDERWVKLYTRDTTEWLSLSWRAQGLLCLVLRKVNRAGVIDLGRLGKRGLSAHIGGASAWPDVEPALDELLADGCVTIEGSTLTVPNFIDAQTSIQSAAARKRAEREKASAVTKRDNESPSVTAGHETRPEVAPESRAVTPSHAPSRDVTLDQNRLDETRRDERYGGAVAPPPPDDAKASPGGDADSRIGAIEAIIASSSALRRGVANARAEAVVIVSRHGDTTNLVEIVERARDYLANTPNRLPSNGADFLRKYILKVLNPKRQRDDDADHAAGSREARIAAAITSSTALREITPRPNAFASAAAKAYPAVDVPAEIARAEAWLIANPANAKSNGARYLNSWLARAQERAPRAGAPTPAAQPQRAPTLPWSRPEPVQSGTDRVLIDGVWFDRATQHAEIEAILARKFGRRSTNG